MSRLARAVSFGGAAKIPLLTLALGASAPGAQAAPASSPEPTPSWSATGNQSDAHFGYSVAPAGDVNGDGYADVLVGARSFDSGEQNEGRAFVYHGSPDGLSSSPDWFVEGDQVLAFLGHRVIRQNHLGDWGTHVGMLIALMFDRFEPSKIDAGEFEIADLDSFYRDAQQRYTSDEV